MMLAMDEKWTEMEYKCCFNAMEKYIPTTTENCCFIGYTYKNVLCFENGHIGYGYL